ncbi:MAG: hypothetical protein KBD90_00455 [Alphaproteobacteria bacterium]|nr:hypothetical protein [Alphaproteobacteria bacterium]
MTLGPLLHPIILMKTLSKNHGEFRLKIPKDLAYFEGHFPDFPVVPGVVQLHWVIEFAQGIFTLPPITGQGSQIKFSQLMRPLDEVDLILDYCPLQSTLTYRYKTDEKIYSSGKFTYASVLEKMG